MNLTAAQGWVLIIVTIGGQILAIMGLYYNSKRGTEIKATVAAVADKADLAAQQATTAVSVAVDHAAHVEDKLNDIAATSTTVMKNTNGHLDTLRNELQGTRDTIAILTNLLTLKGVQMRKDDFEPKRATDAAPVKVQIANVEPIAVTTQGPLSDPSKGLV
jgi:hypothetical protein